MYMLYKLDKHLGSTKSSFINMLSASTPQNVDFAHICAHSEISIVPLKFALGQFCNGIHEQIQHFAELNQENMFIYIHKRLSVYKRFAKFGYQWRTRTFCNKTRKNGQSSLGQTDYRINMNMLCHCS